MTKYKGKDKGGMSINAAKVIWEGHSINALYTMVVDRIVQTDDDLAKVQEMIDNAPVDEKGNKKNPFAATGTTETASSTITTRKSRATTSVPIWPASPLMPPGKASTSQSSPRDSSAARRSG